MNLLLREPLVELVQAYFKEQQPDLAWIEQILLHTL